MASGDFERKKDELLRQAFIKIKQENNYLLEKIAALEERIGVLESQRFEIQKPQIISQKVTTKEVEKNKSKLTPSEMEVLRIFTMSRDKKYTYGELAGVLGKSVQTVKIQILSIIQKGIKLSYTQSENNQRAYYLDSEMFEKVIKARN